MWNDQIVEEIRKYRDEYAKSFNYDLHTICQELRLKQGQGERRVLMLKPRPVKHIPKANKTLQPIFGG